MGKNIKRIGFISTRIAGTDGVSLEIAKWAEVLTGNNFQCFYFAGELDRAPETSFLVKKAHFEHPEIKKINEHIIGKRERTREISESMQVLVDYLRNRIYAFVEKFNIDLIIPENALAIPMNIPLGLALTEFIAETYFPTIAHHHDFYWERDRFLINTVNDYLQRAFPPDLHPIQHVVINSIASEQLSHRKGISNTIIPNVYDFDNPPPAAESYCRDLRKYIGLAPDDIFVLQPTRVVPRKWIERAIEIVYQINRNKPKLIISHASGDEGGEYKERIKEYAKHWAVELVFIDHLIDSQRRTKPNGEKIFTFGDVYQCADIVTYPSGYEGFGNAFLETIYYRKPIVVNRYPIYIADIEPKGFNVISFDGFVTEKIIKKIERILIDNNLRKKMVDKNYRLAQKFFSYQLLGDSLLRLIELCERQQI
jgi:glycosyltransferase involved in cell wall biosynthesis